jgi:hypothetical protein
MLTQVNLPDAACFARIIGPRGERVQRMQVCMLTYADAC